MPAKRLETLLVEFRGEVQVIPFHDDGMTHDCPKAKHEITQWIDCRVCPSRMAVVSLDVICAYKASVKSRVPGYESHAHWERSFD